MSAGTINVPFESVRKIPSLNFLEAGLQICKYGGGDAFREAKSFAHYNKKVDIRSKVSPAWQSIIEGVGESFSQNCEYIREISNAASLPDILWSNIDAEVEILKRTSPTII